MSGEKDFSNGKKSALGQLTKAISSNQVDTDIQPILNIINNSDEYYTTSSCFGRIVILEIPVIGNKKDLDLEALKKLGEFHEMDVDYLFNYKETEVKQ